MLNGRDNVCNDFTSFSTKVSSVVEYCFVNHSCFDKFETFSVLRVTDLISKAKLVSTIASSALPDHLLLLWNIRFDSELNGQAARDSNTKGNSYYKS